ncbi:hypothetical protein OH492_29470 [Vibrio chagasii]|nr:hypothetical protein [Vibrio chagasii]
MNKLSVISSVKQLGENWHFSSVDNRCSENDLCENCLNHEMLIDNPISIGRSMQ